MIEIKDISERIKLSTEIGEGSIRRFELMKEDYVQAKFSLDDSVYFGIGDSVEIEGEPFYITELMYPSFNESTGGYDYDLRFDSHYFRWKNHILFYDRQGNKEASWSLTRSPEAHLGIVVSNVRALGFKYKGLDYQAVVDSSVDTSAKLVQYENTNIIDALTKIAETWECEWWVEGDKIYLGRCEHGEPIDLEIGKELVSMNRSQSKETYANRIYAFGSTRNIPTNYRPNTSDGSVIEGIVTKRLMLPAGIDHVDVIEGLKDSEVVDMVVVFDKVYPRTTCSITSVESKEVSGDTEKGEPETYTVYRIKDTNFHFSKKYILPNEELRIEFQSGPLSGLDFAVTFNPDKVDEDTEAGQVFEIVRNQEYGQWLPADPLKPTIGSQFILYGFDTKFISDQLIGNAEQELLEEAQKFVNKLNIDPSTYNCVVSSYLASGYDERNGILNPSLALNLKAGQKVNLINRAYFKDGRVSRVIGFEKKLDVPYDSPTYIVGESSAYSRIGELEEKIDNIQFKGNTYVNQGSGGGSIYVIKKDDPTAASDENVFSALRTLQEINQIRFSVDEMYLRKDINDTAHGIISFDQKIGSSIFLDGYDGKGWEIKETGAALFDSAQVRSDIFMGGKIGSPSFASGFTGWGWEIDTPTASGTVDNWTVRKSMKVYEMVYSQVYGLNSSFLVSEWNKIKLVTPLGSNRYRCEIDDMDGEMFVNLRNGDIVRSKERDGCNIRYFASEVENVTGESFDLKVIEGIDSPQPGDYVQRIGSKVDRNRQGLIYFTSSDDYAPYIDILDEVTGAQFGENNTKVRIGNLRGIRINGEPLNINGIYIKGGIFDECDIYLEDGTTIYQSFQIINGKLESEISSVRDAINDNGNNILSNPTWAAGLDKWSYTQDIELFSANNGWLWFNAAFYADKKSSVEVVQDGPFRVLRIYKSGITQLNADLQSKEPGTYVMRIRYRGLTAGTLAYGFSGKELYRSVPVTATTDYQEETITAPWDGTGDFSCTYSGDIYIKSITVISDKIASIRSEFETKITQTDQSIELLAKRVTTTEEGVTRAQASISVMADEIALKATKDEFNDLGRRVTANEASIKVNADNIELKVSQTDFNSLGRRVTSAESAIETNAYNITLKASQSSVSSLTGRVSSAESSIRVNAGNITNKVAKTDYNGVNIVSMINQTADSVKILASKVDIQAYNMNLIRNSGQMTKTTYWSSAGKASAPNVQNKSISMNCTGEAWLTNKSLAGVRLFSTRKYTLRVSLNTSLAQRIMLSIGPDSNGLLSWISFPSGNSEKTFTFQGKDVDAEYLRIYLNSTCSISVNWVKLEEGEYATPWTPNPNDSIYSLDSDLVSALNGTTISGGLQLTTKIKLGLLSGGVWTEQGGISANMDNIMLWAGGTYDQAKAGNAKTILYHDGSGKWTGRLESNSEGNRIVIDPSDRALRMYIDNLSVLNMHFYKWQQNTGSKIVMSMYSGSAIKSECEVSSDGISASSPSGVTFFGASVTNQKIWIDAALLPQGRDAAYPREVYMDGEYLKVKRV